VVEENDTVLVDDALGVFAWTDKTLERVKKPSSPERDLPTVVVDI
jgi:hypothetical protein